MGILRFILALAVVTFHSAPLYGLRFTGGLVSVQTFYIISGFYMALILNEKYTEKGSYKLFITNRFLRIFPAYWVVLLLTIAFSAFPFFTHKFNFTVQDYVGNNHLLSLGSIAFLGITNLILFGQDMVLFLTADANGCLCFTANFWKTNPKLFPFMAVPQAWTLSLELMFYLIAPFFAKRNIYILLSVIFTSLALRFYIYFLAGLYHDPWTYRFFPTELAFFLAGTISYRLYLVIKEKPIDKRIPTVATVFVVCVTLGFQFITGPFFIKQWIYYGLVVLLMPLLFIFSNSNRSLDGRIGDLSYPIYISQIFVIALLAPLLNTSFLSKHIGILACVATVIFSMILVHFVISPIENYRQNRIRKAA